MGNPTSKLHPLANDALLATNNSFTKKMEERYVNKVILVGRTTRDVEVKHGGNVGKHYHHAYVKGIKCKS